MHPSFTSLFENSESVMDETKMKEFEDFELNADGEVKEKNTIGAFNEFQKILFEELDVAFGGDVSKVVTSIPELAFIMNKAAEAKEGKVDMNLLNKEMYYEWLEQFEPMDLPMATEDIVDVYMANNKVSSEPKKKG